MKPFTSTIWNYFVYITIDSAKCKICEKVYSRKGGTTTSLKGHLKSLHPKKYEDFAKADSEKKTRIMSNVPKVEVYASSNMRAGTDGKLIAAVRARRVLYDSTHARYMDNNHKIDVWKEVGQQLKANPTACKARWNNIRDNYRKSLRKKPAERARSCRYKYADQLTFMTKFLKSNDDADEAEEDDDDDDETETASANSATSANEALVEFPTIKVDANDVEIEHHDTATDYEFFDKRESVDKATSFPVYPSSMHAVDAFLAGLSPTMKAMSPYHLSLAKAEIFATVHKYEMKGIMDGGGWRRDVNPLP